MSDFKYFDFSQTIFIFCEIFAYNFVSISICLTFCQFYVTTFFIFCYISVTFFHSSWDQHSVRVPLIQLYLESLSSTIRCWKLACLNLGFRNQPTQLSFIFSLYRHNQQLAGLSARFQLISQSNSSELIANFPFQTARCWPVLKLSGLFGQKGRRSRRRPWSKWTRAQEVFGRQSGERNEQNSISD